MKCPVCKDSNLLMSDRQGIEIDYCNECRGVWLDRGELDKIIEKTNADSSDNKSSGSRDYQSDNRSDNRNYDSHSDHNDRNNNNDYSKNNDKKKKGNFLGDLLDF